MSSKSSSIAAEPPALIGVVGPTATGKTALAIELAEALNGEIISVDSAAIFTGLDVGTAKPTARECARVPHHLIDVITASQQWSAADFAGAADDVIARLVERGKRPIICGGTGLWLRALLHGIFEAPPIEPEIRTRVREALQTRGAPAMHAVLTVHDPVAAARIAENDPQRIGRALEVFEQTGTPISELQAAHGFREQRYPFQGIFIEWDKAALAERIGRRTAAMFAGGILEETQAALEAGHARDCPGLQIIGYREAVRCVLDGLETAEAVTATETATRRYAKRQRNWFRKDVGLLRIPAGTDSAEVLDLLQRSR